LVTGPVDEIRGKIVQVKCQKCQTENFLQYHCWACSTPLDGIDYNKTGVQGQCPECQAFNPGKVPRKKDSCDDFSNRCTDRIMFGFTAFIQPYCVYAQTMWIYPYVMASMGARGGVLEAFLYIVTFIVSAGTLFNYWAGVFTKVPKTPLPARGELKLKSDPATTHFKSVARFDYCVQCKAPRAPRDHHCNICRTCVPVMDHHCPFYGGSCVGRHNHRNFLLFLLYMMMTTIWLATTTLAFLPHLPGFPSFVFQRDFSRKIMAACAGASPFCPMQYIWSFPEVSTFGVVVIQLVLTILTLILVSVLFQQQYTDLKESRTRLEGIIAKSKSKKKKEAKEQGKEVAEEEEEGGGDDVETEVDDEGRVWGELRDVCGAGRSKVAWVCVPFVGTLKSHQRYVDSRAAAAAAAAAAGGAFAPATGKPKKE
jgi:hypothetical protein